MRLSVKISSLLIVLCVSGVFSSPSVDRDQATWGACRSKCGKLFSGDLSDDAQYACLIGCCPTVRSLSHQVHSEVQQEEEEEEERAVADADTLKEYKKKFPKIYAWNSCVTKIAKDPSNVFKGITECCKNPPV